MKEINIKIVFNYNDDSENYIICYIESSYPSPEQYIKGVRGILFFAERKDPRAKVFDYQLRASVHRELASEGAYEALLVNENNEITEGSKSNIFFLKDDKLVTAPDHTVLNGITRKHILQICEAEGIKVEFSCIDADNLGEYESVFMTGTSSAVLPFNSINGCHFRTDQPLIGRIRKLYILKAEESIRDFSS